MTDAATHGLVSVGPFDEPGVRRRGSSESSRIVRLDLTCPGHDGHPRHEGPCWNPGITRESISGIAGPHCETLSRRVAGSTLNDSVMARAGEKECSISHSAVLLPNPSSSLDRLWT